MSDQTPESAPEIAAEIKTSGDPAARFTRLRHNIGARITGLGTVTTIGYQAAMGHEVVSPSLVFYGAIAASGIVAANTVHRRREKHAVGKAEEKQAALREAVDEPVDLFVEGKRKKTTVLRWYGADHFWTKSEKPIIATLPDRFAALAKMAQDCGIDEIECANSLLELAPTKVREGFDSGHKRTDLTSTKRKLIQDNYAAFATTRMTPAKALELVELLEKPTSKERQTALTRMEALVGNLAKIEASEEHIMVSLFRKFATSALSPEQAAHLKAALKTKIESRFESVEGAPRKTLQHGKERKRQVHSTALLAGNKLTLFQQTGNSHDGSSAYFTARPLLEHTGYADFASLWDAVMDEKSALSPDEYTFAAEVAAWQLLQLQLHNDATKPKFVEQEIITSNEWSKGATYFARLSGGGKVSELPAVRVKERRGRIRRTITPLAALAVAAGIAMPTLGVDQANEFHQSAPHSSQDSLAVAGGALQKARTADREISHDVSSLGKAMDKLLDNGREGSNPPESAIGNDEHDYKSGVGDAYPTKNANGEPDWKLTAAPGVKTDGYWAASVKSYVGTTRHASVPPYTSLGMEFIEKIPDDSELTIMSLKSPEDMAGVPFIKASGERLFSNLVSITESTPLGSTEQKIHYYALNLPVKEGSVPAAQKVEIIPYEEKARPITIPARIAQTKEHTYKLLIDKTTASRWQDTGSLRINYWLDTNPAMPQHSQAVQMMTDVDRGKPLADVMTTEQVAQVTKALGLPAGRSYSPQELAEQIQKTKKYSRTPYLDAGLLPGDAEFNVLTDRLKYKPMHYQLPYVNMAVVGAELSSEVCNTATMIGVIGSEGGTPENFVNPVSGYGNNGDSALEPEEAHSYMVTNKGETVEATPTGYARTPMTHALKVEEAPISPGAAIHDLQHKSKIPLGVLGGLGALIAGVGITRRASRQAKHISQKAVATGKAAQEKRSKKWLLPKDETQQQQRHELITTAVGIMYGGNSQPQQSMSTAVFSKPLPDRYRNLGQFFSPATLQPLISERRKQGWQISAATERRLLALARKFKRAKMTE